MDAELEELRDALLGEVRKSPDAARRVERLMKQSGIPESTGVWK
ncbi:hypothetical protein [Streptomyces fulvoviolaceus]|nr:hypothetical protein [Streptomyces fulvoviolaceus]